VIVESSFNSIRLTRPILILDRLIASIREIEFDSRNRIESWRFDSNRIESFDDSIPKVGIDNSIQFQSLNRKSNRKIESNRQDDYF
jgi:hypothetical protein